jgi:expansin (peptidoglycan-binding protein)
MRSPLRYAGCGIAMVSLCVSAAHAGCAPPYSASAAATFYDAAVNSGGACSLTNIDGETTAITFRRWLGSAHCGECLLVRGPLASTIVKVTDECPDCTHSDLDLTRGAFAKIGVLSDGVIPISWQRVDCPVSGGLKLQVQDGVNPYYMSFLADQTLQGVAAMRIKQSTSASWQAMTRLDYGYFNVTGSPLNFPLAVEVTSQSGEVVQIANAIPDASAGVSYQRPEQFGACSDRVFASDFGSDL